MNIVQNKFFLKLKINIGNSFSYLNDRTITFIFMYYHKNQLKLFPFRSLKINKNSI
jgi:hypothetical protein